MPNDTGSDQTGTNSSSNDAAWARAVNYAVVELAVQAYCERWRERGSCEVVW